MAKLTSTSTLIFAIALFVTTYILSSNSLSSSLRSYLNLITLSSLTPTPTLPVNTPLIASLTLLTIFVISQALVILNPVIINYPYPPSSSSSSISDKQKTVYLAGSYNPPHLGHVAMLKYLSKRYGNVIAVIGFNPKKTYDVSPVDRVELMNDIIKGEDDSMDNVTAQVVEGLIWRHAASHNIHRLYRGIRTWKQDGASEQYLLFQNTFWPFILGPLTWPVSTVFLEGDKRFNHISSTVVRNLCKREAGEEAKRELEGLVSECIVDRVSDVYK